MAGTSHLHGQQRSAKRNKERLANSSGTLITYLDAEELEATLTERYDGTPPTCETGTAYSSNGVAGTVDGMTQDYLYGKKMGATGTQPTIVVVTTVQVDTFS